MECKKSDKMYHEKKGFIRSNGSGSYEFVRWCKDQSEGEICIFREIRSKSSYTSRIYLNKVEMHV